jgi:hypothetical protein
MTYADHPTALQLRAMNVIYETTKERGATILIPTSCLDPGQGAGGGNRFSLRSCSRSARLPTAASMHPLGDQDGT